MEIGTIASKKSCSGAGSGINTGKLGCLSLFGTPTHMIAVRKGFEILATAEFNDAYIRPLVQNGTMIPLIDASSFEDLSSEDAYSTNAKGVKRLNVKGLPEYRLVFEEGHEFYREISKLESFKRFDFLIGDAEGNWIIARKSNGNFQGMTAGHVTPQLTMRKVEGGDAESKSIVVQFLDRLQWDTNYEILHAEDLDLTPQEMPVVNGTEISFNANPEALDTTVDVKVTLASDRDTAIVGLEQTDFSVLVNGATAAISGLAETAGGNYALTIPALAANDTVQVNHLGTASNVADSNGVLYRNSIDNTSIAA